MIAKLAVLFLVVMGTLALIKGRGKKKRIKQTSSRATKPAEAVRCPDCNSWIVAGSSCPCTAKKPGNPR
jgi:ribosomal protein L32